MAGLLARKLAQWDVVRGDRRTSSRRWQVQHWFRVGSPCVRPGIGRNPTSPQGGKGGRGWGMGGLFYTHINMLLNVSMLSYQQPHWVRIKRYRGPAEKSRTRAGKTIVRCWSKTTSQRGLEPCSSRVRASNVSSDHFIICIYCANRVDSKQFRELPLCGAYPRAPYRRDNPAVAGGGGCCAARAAAPWDQRAEGTHRGPTPRRLPCSCDTCVR